MRESPRCSIIRLAAPTMRHDRRASAVTRLRRDHEDRFALSAPPHRAVPVILPCRPVHTPRSWARAGAPWRGPWQSWLLALLALALPLQSTAIAVSRMAGPAHVHRPVTQAPAAHDAGPTACGDADADHDDHDHDHDHASDLTRSEACAPHDHHGHIAHHSHPHDDPSVVAMPGPPGDDDPSAPGKRALVDHDPIAGTATWRPPPDGMIPPPGAMPMRFVSHVSPPPERPPR